MVGPKLVAVRLEKGRNLLNSFDFEELMEPQGEKTSKQLEVLVWDW